MSPYIRVRRRRRRRLALIVAGVTAGVLILLGAVALLVASDIRDIRQRVTAATRILQQEANRPQPTASAEAIRRLGRATDRATIELRAARRTYQRSLPLRFSKVIPVIGKQSSGLDDLTRDALALSDAGLQMLAIAGRISDQAEIDETGAIPLEDLATLQQAVQATVAAAHDAQGARAGLWPTLRRGRTEFNTFARTAEQRLGGAAAALDLGRDLLGESRSRRFLIAAQNNAEMRAQGAVLSYAIVIVDAGLITVERHGSVNELEVPNSVATMLPPGTEQVFGGLQPRRQWRSVNATFDFALAGELMTDLAASAGAGTLDGVIGVDVVALVELLKESGAVTVPELGTVTAQNAAKLLLQDTYAGVPPGGQAERREHVAGTTVAVIDAVKANRMSVISVLRAATNAARGGHVQLYSRNRGEQDRIERLGLSGRPGLVRPERTFALAVENLTPTKLDYFVRPAVSMQISLSSANTATVRTTVRIVNNAPGGPPSYVLGPDGVQERAGHYVGSILQWGPRGSQQLASVDESGLELAQQLLDVFPKESDQVTFETVIPFAVENGEFVLRLVNQPRLQPARLRVDLQLEGWTTSDRLSVARPWDRTLTLRWKLRKG